MICTRSQSKKGARLGFEPRQLDSLVKWEQQVGCKPHKGNDLSCWIGTTEHLDHVYQSEMCKVRGAVLVNVITLSTICTDKRARFLSPGNTGDPGEAKVSTHLQSC